MAVFEISEYKIRIAAIQSIMKQNNIALAVFNQNSDLFYYCGSIQPLYLLIPAFGEPVLAARKAAERINEENGFIKLEIFSNSQELLKILNCFNIKPGEKIGFTFDTTSFATVNRIRQYFPEAGMADLSWDTRFQRSVKSAAELDCIRKAGSIIKKIPELLMSHYQPGMTELELSVIIESYLRLNGDGGIHSRQEAVKLEAGLCSSGISSLAGSKFDGICGGSGISPVNPYGASNACIEKNIPVIVDYAFSSNGYHVDQTRMFSFGKPSKEVLKAYDSMLIIHDQIISSLKPGLSWTSVYEKSLKAADKLGYTEYFMGEGLGKVRFVGHGVGLELDEPPFLAPKMEYPLKAGMAIAIEPKVALPGIGVVGIEDTVIIQEYGIEKITDCPNDWILFE